MKRYVRDSKAISERLAKWRALKPEDQLKELDLMFGKGLGAVKQRKRIAKKLEDKNVHLRNHKEAQRPQGGSHPSGRRNQGRDLHSGNAQRKDHRASANARKVQP